MTTNSLRIRLIEPRAEKLLAELAALKLIAFEPVESEGNELKAILKKLRSSKQANITLKSISDEVEKVRSKRYAKK